MAEIKKHALLLTVLALMLTAKFIVVPIIIWQDQLLLEIAMQEKKLGKSDVLLSKKSDHHTINDKLKGKIAEIETLFYPYQKGSTFKLERQKKFESIIEQYQLKLKSFYWQAVSNEDNLDVMRYTVKIKITGQVSDIINMLTLLESQSHYIEIQSFNVLISRKDYKSLGYVKTSNFTLRFYVNNKADSKGKA